MYLMMIFAMLLLGCDSNSQKLTANKSVFLQETSTKKFVISLEISAPKAPKKSFGGLIAADVNDDDAYDLLVTAPGYIGAYATDGKLLWSKQIDVRVSGQSESQGLPGHHGPGVQAGDINDDGKTEVVFFDQSSTLHVLRGNDGRKMWSAKLEPPKGAKRWEHVVITNFRGNGDRDLLIQATNANGYRMGKYVAAYAVELLKKGKKEPLWQRNDFISCAHNGARVADLDGDGRDEVLGATILGPDGELRLQLNLDGHIDSVFTADVRPDITGLEVVLLEEGSLNRVILTGISQLIWETHYNHQEPQNAAIGRFISGRPDLQIWCRSRHNEHQKPFVFDAAGKLHSEYNMDDVAPKDWTVKGVEVIHSIYWTGEDRQLACAKERHKNGDVCIFDPTSGEFLLHLPETSNRLYVADVIGDWREEIIVWSNNELHVYTNNQPNPRPDMPRLWTIPHYKRGKITWNYYSP